MSKSENDELMAIAIKYPVTYEVLQEIKAWGEKIDDIEEFCSKMYNIGIPINDAWQVVKRYRLNTRTCNIKEVGQVMRNIIETEKNKNVK